MKQLAAEHSLGVRTLQRWLAAYRRDDAAGLQPKVPPARGHRAPAELVALIEGLALMAPRPTTTSITGKANTVAADHGWHSVSYSTVRSIIACLDPGMATLAHRGSAAYRDKYELVWRRRAERPNAIWQADHTELDILILDVNQKPARPWLTIILDDHSRAIFG